MWLERETHAPGERIAVALAIGDRVCELANEMAVYKTRADGQAMDPRIRSAAGKAVREQSVASRDSYPRS